ncbi:MAG: hypothetical protein FWC70_11740 [Defluviitaleaceae bacterium]|nr:hypothetical protein [Defluviitaleaceae bacterium]
MNNNDTVPTGLAILLFAFLGILILGALVFAGINAVSLAFGGRGDTVAVTKDFSPEDAKADFVASQQDNVGGTPTFLDANGGDEVQPPRPDTKPMPTPVPTPEPTPAPAPVGGVPRPAPSPTPAPPQPVPCGSCSAAAVEPCQRCGGVGGGRGRPFMAGTPYDVQEVSGQDDIWWCTACAGNGEIACRTCAGSGYVMTAAE